MARSLDSYKAEAEARRLHKTEAARARLLGDLHPVSAAAQHEEARLAVQNSPNGATITAHYPMLAEVLDELGGAAASARAAAWKARYVKLAKVERADAVFRAAIRQADSTGELQTAFTTYKAALAAALA